MRHALPSASVTDEIPGFPERFPVRDDGVRSWRYQAVSLICRASLRGFFGRGLQLDPMSKFPAEGPLLVVCNHLSNIDPWIFGGFGPGVLYCMSKRELFNNPVIAWILAGCNCFPIDRGAADRRALRTALDMLAAPRPPAHLPGRHTLGHAGNATRRSRGRLPRAPFGGVDPAGRRLGHRGGASSGSQAAPARAHPAQVGSGLPAAGASCPGSGVTTRRWPISSGRESPNSFPLPTAGSTRLDKREAMPAGSDSRGATVSVLGGSRRACARADFAGRPLGRLAAAGERFGRRRPCGQVSPWPPSLASAAALAPDFLAAGAALAFAAPASPLVWRCALDSALAASRRRAAGRGRSLLFVAVAWLPISAWGARRLHLGSWTWQPARLGPGGRGGLGGGLGLGRGLRRGSAAGLDLVAGAALTSRSPAWPSAPQPP